METLEKQFIDKLYDEMYRQMLLYARRILHDNSLAEEVVQETFRIACKKIDDVIASPNPEGWLFLTLQNAIRTMKRNQSKLARMFVYVSAVESLDKYCDAAIMEEEPDLLYGDLIGQQDYELIKKFAVDKKSLAEIADEAGISINACKQRIFRAKRTLRSKIAKYDEDKNIHNKK